MNRMSKKNPLQGALTVTLIAIATVTLSYFVLGKRKDTQEKSKERSALLYPDLERGKVVDFRVFGPNGTFHLKRKAAGNSTPSAAASDEWLIEAPQAYDADKTSVDGVISTVLASKNESPVANSDLAALGLQPAKYKLSIANGSETPKAELLVGDDTPVDYLVYAKWSDKPEVFTTTRSLRFSLDKKLTDLRNKKIFTAEKDKITKLEIKTMAGEKSASTQLVIEKDDTGLWKASVAGAKVTLDKAEVEKYIQVFTGMSVIGFASEEASARDKLGFRNPAAKLTITVKGDKGAPTTESWALARQLDASQNQKDVKNKVYRLYWARLDQPSTYELGDTFKDNFVIDLFKFRPKSLFKFNKSDVTSLSLGNGVKNFEFKKEGARWTAKSSGEKGGELTGNGKTPMIEKILDAVSALKAKNYLDGQSPYQTGLKQPTRVLEVRGLKEGKEQTLATLFFGRKLKGEDVAMRAEGMDSAAAVEFKIDEILPLTWESFAETTTPPAAPAAGAGGGPPAAPGAHAPVAPGASPEATKGAKKVKLEPTVSSVKEIQKLPGSIVKKGFKYTAEINLSTGSKIVITFAPDKAPYTVSNFLHLARNGFYNGVKFHRVIPDFVAQGGDPTGTGMGGPGYKFDNEDNDLKHKRGSISMAHAGRNTNGSQFFLVLKPQPHLDGIHTVFGEITQGLDALDAIKPNDVMKTVEVFEEGL